MVIRFLIEKEFKQIVRNTILPKIFVILPVVLTLVVPLVATQEVKNLKISVVDNDHSTMSSRLTQKLAASTYFTLTDAPSSYQRAMDGMEAGTADFIIEIAPDFEHSLVTEGTSHVMISANAVNGVKAGLGSSYLAQIIADYADDLRNEHSSTQNTNHSTLNTPPSTLNTKHSTLNTQHSPLSTVLYLFNPTLDYKVFMIPALMAMLLILIVGFLPAINIVSEKEKGTIEQINVTPVGRFEFILSKLIPYWTIGLVLLSYSMLLARLVYGLAPAGNLGVLYLFASLFILVVSSLGLIVSNYSDTTQQAALTIFFFLIIFMLMSGLLTPIDSMPQLAKTITTINPMRYFIAAMRTLYLKGSSLSELMPNLRALAIAATVTWTWAIYSYKKNK